MTITLQPLRNRLLVRLRPSVQKGLVIRPNNHESAGAADILAIGPEVRDFEVGQGVLVSVMAGQLVGDDILLPESSILAYLDD
jgi:co-chaperonin GroES (HSP10)